MTTNAISREEFDALAKRVATIESQMSTSEVKSHSKKDLSKREVFLQYNLKADTKRCLVIMSILDAESGETGFNQEAIRGLYKSIKEKIPKNLSDKIYQLHKKGFIHTLSNKGKNRMYSLTNTGLEELAKLKKEEEK